MTDPTKTAHMGACFILRKFYEYSLMARTFRLRGDPSAKHHSIPNRERRRSTFGLPRPCNKQELAC